MLLNEIGYLILCELVETVDVDNLIVNCCFDDEKIIVCFELWTE